MPRLSCDIRPRWGLPMLCIACLVTFGKDQRPAPRAPDPLIRVELSRAIPWVGEPVRVTGVVTGVPAASRWTLSGTLHGPEAGTDRALFYEQVAAGADGSAGAGARLLFPRPGWYTVRIRARNPATGRSLNCKRTLPVTRFRVDFAWYQAEEARELRWPTIQLTAGKPEQQDYWRRRGVLPARWCGAACGKDKPEEFFVRKWSRFPAIAIDEFGGGKKACEKFTRALQRARKRNPDGFIAVWFTGGWQYWPRLRDVLDLFLPEVYLNYGPYNLIRLDDVVRDARRAGVFENMLPGLGINVVRSKDGTVRRRPTPDEIIAEIAHLKEIAPDLRGLAFFTYASAEPDVRAAVDQACRDYFLAPVIDLLDARALPERTPPGRPFQIEARLRNAGGMPARSLTLRVRDAAGRSVGQTTASHLKSREERTVRFPVDARRLPGAGVLTVEVLETAGVTLLQHVRHVPFIRRSSGPAAYIPPIPVRLPPGYPVDVAGMSESPRVTGRRVPAADFADARGDTFARHAPGLFRRLPDDVDVLTFISPGLTADAPALAFLSSGPTEGDAGEPGPVTLERNNDGTIRVRTAAYEAVYAPDQDALISITAGRDRRELTGSPWKVSWKAWKGFGKPRIRRFAAAVEIVTPLAGDGLSGTSRYTCYPRCIEIERWFQAADDLLVTYAAEGARFEQHPGQYALQFGVGARPQCDRLKVTKKYQDLYFGSPGLGPDKAGMGGWFDFCWDAPHDAGLGVAVLRQWERRDSKVHYDVTRWYDAADWLEVVQVWHAPVRVRRGYSRIVLIPHGRIEISPARLGGVPARAVWERMHAPGRLLRRGSR